MLLADSQTSTLSFLVGLISVVVIAGALKTVIGMKMNLYLVSKEPDLKSTTVIPLTAELKKRSLWKTILRKDWQEDLELTLADYSNHYFSFLIGYSLWKGFYLMLQKQETCFIHQTKMIAGRLYPLRSGVSLHLGDRSFTILVSASPLETLNRYENLQEIPSTESIL
jgi:hypothetical protein